MPIIKIYSPKPCPNNNVLRYLCKEVTQILDIPSNHAWAFWQEVKETSFYKTDWDDDINEQPAPMIFIYCKETYSEYQIKEVLENISEIISAKCNCDKKKIYIACQRIKPGHLSVRGDLWIG